MVGGWGWRDSAAAYDANTECSDSGYLVEWPHRAPIESRCREMNRTATHSLRNPKTAKRASAT
eukprot:2654887-Amphidinium_carterae.1